METLSSPLGPWMEGGQSPFFCSASRSQQPTAFSDATPHSQPYPPSSCRHPHGPKSWACRVLVIWGQISFTIAWAGFYQFPCGWFITACLLKGLVAICLKNTQRPRELKIMVGRGSRGKREVAPCWGGMTPELLDWRGIWSPSSCWQPIETAVFVFGFCENCRARILTSLTPRTDP